MKNVKDTRLPVNVEGKASRRGALGSPALHLAVVKFLCYLPLVPRGDMAVRVQLDLSLGSPFPARVARVFEQVVVVVLVVKRLLERNKAFHICRHLETECCSFHQTSLGTSKQMMSSCVYIHAVTWPLLCLSVVKEIMTTV